MSKCLTSRVIHEEEELRSSGLVPFNKMMIATYQEFATMFKQALKCYYNALKKRPEERNFVHYHKTAVLVIYVKVFHIPVMTVRCILIVPW